MRRALATIMLCAGLALAACGGGDQAHDSMTVPRVEGATVLDAKRQLTRRGLQWSLGDQAPSSSAEDTGPMDTQRVIEQAPGPGTRVTPGSAVTIETACSAAPAFMRCV